MSYSYTRFRRVLALSRITVGLMFVVSGCTKLFDPTFFASGFTGALVKMSASSAQWYMPLMHYLWNRPGYFAVLAGLVELFLGIALVLGLATRPAAFLGMFYMFNRVAITWYPGGNDPSLYQYLDAHAVQITFFLLFLLFAVGRAGETWGVGAIYHNQPFESPKTSLRNHPEYSYLYEPEKEEERADYSVSPTRTGT